MVSLEPRAAEPAFSAESTPLVRRVKRASCRPAAIDSDWTSRSARSGMATGPQSRKEALAERVASARERVDAMPGAPLVREVIETERDLGGGLIAGGVAFRIFLWLVPLGLVVAALLSFWVEHDEDGLEDATREFG